MLVLVCLTMIVCKRAGVGGRVRMRVFLVGRSSGEDSLLVGVSVYVFSAALGCTDVILSLLLIRRRSL